MSEIHFEAEITLSERAMEGDRAIWSSASEVLSERAYGAVRVRAEWSVPEDMPAIRVPLRVIDARDSGDARDLPAFIELFFHDVFLLFNLASPGSFGGVIAVSGGAYRVRELALDARVFESISARLATLPLRDVVAWYDAQQVGVRQIANTGVEKALFHLLHLARAADSDELSIFRLAHAVESLNAATDTLAPFFALREAVARGKAPVMHPMYDDALDPAVEDEAHDWTGVIDDAAYAVLAAIRSRMNSCAPPPDRRGSSPA